MADAAIPARQRMIQSTALLVRERGARATSIDDVLAHSDAPRGSVYHHFPGGREQLLREATEYAGDFVAARLEDAAGSGPLQAVDRLFGDFEESLEATDYRAGCPIVAVAVEAATGGADLRPAAAAAFDRWREVLRADLEANGVAHDRADELAVYAIGAFEGALVLSRAGRTTDPLEIARREIRTRIQAELMEAESR